MARRTTARSTLPAFACVFACAAVACAFAACGGTTGQASASQQADASDAEVPEAGPVAQPDDDGADGCEGDGLTPDDTGFVAGDTNASGINGAWHLYRDCDDYPMFDAGSPKPGVNCSLVMAPVPGQPFAPQAGTAQMCTQGRTVQDLMDQHEDTEWGSYVALDLNDVNGTPQDFDAKAAGVNGFCFYVAGAAVPYFRVRLATDQPIADRNWYQVTLQHEGWHRVLFSELKQVTPTDTSFDPSKLLSLEIEIPSSSAGPVPWDFCVDGLVALN